MVANGETYVGRDQPRPQGPGANRGAPPRAGDPLPSSLANAAANVDITRQGDQLFARVDVGANDLLLTTSQADIDHTMSVLQTVELLAGAALLLIAGLLSFMVVRGALGPFRKMTALADRIRSGDRGLRLRPTHPDSDLGRTATAIDSMLDSLEAAESEAQSAEVRMRQFLADGLARPAHAARGHVGRGRGPAAGRSGAGRTGTTAGRADPRGTPAGRLVDDLLLMARLDDPDPSSALMRADTDLGQLVAVAVEQARPLMRDRTIELT